MNWIVIPREEQETLINVDYCEKKIIIYTSRKQVAERLQRKIGNPTNVYSNRDGIYAVDYKRDLFDKDVGKFFSRPLIIGSFRESD